MIYHQEGIMSGVRERSLVEVGTRVEPAAVGASKFRKSRLVLGGSAGWFGRRTRFDQKKLEGTV